MRPRFLTDRRHEIQKYHFAGKWLIVHTVICGFVKIVSFNPTAALLRSSCVLLPSLLRVFAKCLISDNSLEASRIPHVDPTAVTAVPAPRVDPDTSPPLAHLSIAGEVRLSPCGGAAPSGRCCDPETMADGRLAGKRVKMPRVSSVITILAAPN